MIGGVDFEFRTIGSASRDLQLWIAGQALYGVRSSEVDCTTPENRPAVCTSIKDDLANQGALIGDKFIYALEHATSFEAYLAPRLELWTLQRNTIFPAKLYVFRWKDGLNRGADPLSVLVCYDSPGPSRIVGADGTGVRADVFEISA
jgi:hypothetical protein